MIASRHRQHYSDKFEFIQSTIGPVKDAIGVDLLTIHPKYILTMIANRSEKEVRDVRKRKFNSNCVFSNRGESISNQICFLWPGAEECSSSFGRP